MRFILITLLFIASAARCVFADDFGPRGDVREVRFVAQRLLAHSARYSKVDPDKTRLSDVVVVKDAALLSWDIGASHGLMGLIRQYDRWWDALEVYKTGSCWNGASASYPLQGASWKGGSLGPTSKSLFSYGLPASLVAQAGYNSDVHGALGNRFVPSCDVISYELPKLQPIERQGGSLASFRWDTSGYEIAVRYAANNARDALFHTPYARAPTQAEIIPYPTTLHFLSTAVLYLDLTIDGSAPVKFQPGTTIDIWVPFVLDDTLRYDLTVGFADVPIGPIYAKPFDNVLHYTLPGFTATPGRTLMAEIDGNWP